MLSVVKYNGRRINIRQRRYRMKSKLNKQQKESLDNRIVFVSSAMFLYAMLLMFIQLIQLLLQQVRKQFQLLSII